jgi:hypothetical protein
VADARPSGAETGSDLWRATLHPASNPASNDRQPPLHPASNPASNDRQPPLNPATHLASSNWRAPSHPASNDQRAPLYDPLAGLTELVAGLSHGRIGGLTHGRSHETTGGLRHGPTGRASDGLLRGGDGDGAGCGERGVTEGAASTGGTWHCPIGRDYIVGNEYESFAKPNTKLGLLRVILYYLNPITPPKNT